MAAIPPKISVLLPVYNARPWIARAVNSILHQTFQDFELILVDDGSTDGSADIAETLTAPRVRLFRRPHTGLVAALNFGLQQARGEWIARMDADDESLPQRLEKQWVFAQQHPHLGGIGCLVDMQPQDRLTDGMRRYIDWLNAVRSEAEIDRNRLIEMPLAHPTLMLRRTDLVAAGGYREGDFPEDYELFLRLWERGVRMAKVPDVLYRWYDHSGRLSRRSQRYRAEAFLRLKVEHAVRTLLAGRRLRLWGGGPESRRWLKLLREHGFEPETLIDVDARKIGKQWAGVPVVHYTQVRRDGSLMLVCVGRPDTREKIRQYLQTNGFHEGTDFVCVS